MSHWAWSLMGKQMPEGTGEAPFPPYFKCSTLTTFISEPELPSLERWVTPWTEWFLMNFIPHSLMKSSLLIWTKATVSTNLFLLYKTLWGCLPSDPQRLQPRRLISSDVVALSREKWERTPASCSWSCCWLRSGFYRWWPARRAVSLIMLNINTNKCQKTSDHSPVSRVRPSFGSPWIR